MNYNYFDSIDTEEKAYWLGFIFADGNVSRSEWTKKDGTVKKGVYRMEVSLKSEDVSHLEKLKTALEVTKEINISKAPFRKERCRLFFNNKHMWTVLNSYGCVPNKSLSLKFPDKEIFKTEDLIKHFIRGYIDGDGCISYNNGVHTKMSLRILGTESFLNSAQIYLPLERKNKLAKTTNIYELCFNNSRGLYICHYLYKTATVYLDRKYIRYKEYCRLYEGS